jgi:serine protease Do
MKKINIKILALSLTLVLALILSAGCFLPSAPATTPPETPPTTASPPATQTPTTPINPGWTAPPTESNAPQLPDYVAVVAKVKPSVVAIKTDLGAGSGWIIHPDGLIVTNNHVVEGASSVTVTLDDGSTFPSQSVSTDPLTDLAIVKIDAQNLPAADIGDSSALKIGEQVAAIGNSLGLGISMKGGWISRLGVSIAVSAGQTLDDLIETDAAINPGNSGGPLVDMAGEVIGITSAKIAMVGVEGMGYAISINTAMPIINQLITNGYVIRSYLGVQLADVNPTMVWWYNLAVDKGAFVTYVEPGSPADEVGIKVEDVIVSLDDEEISTAQGLIKAIHARPIGQEVKIVFWRGNTENTVSATLTQSPPH